jgi:DNA-binding GntR family transcriptional regulator
MNERFGMTGRSYKVVRQPSFRSQAIDQIRHAIVWGELAPGSMHSETTIAKTLSISRTPVREALLQLAQEGLVEFVPQRGVRIADFDPIYLNHMFQLRAAIESFCADQLAANPDRELIATFKRELERQKVLVESSNTYEWPQANVDFHSLIVRSANNPLIDEVVRPLVSHTMRFGFHTNSRNSRMNQSLVEHRAIVEAIERGDRNAARSIAANHMLHAASLMEKVVSDFVAHKDKNAENSLTSKRF